MCLHPKTLLSTNSHWQANNSHAAPAEGVESNSGAGSGMQSSPDGASSFSHVQSVSRSDSSKRSRNAIKDAERESRPKGRVHTNPTRSDRTPSTPRPTRVSAYRRTFHKTASPKRSPRSKSGPMSADEELEARLREMENDGIVLRTEMRQIEDEQIAERNQFQTMFQTARDEWQEFNNQYNHVIGCWREAEEKSRRFESEFMSEAMLFHEAKNGLQELQQHMNSAVQEDYGASLRINELEILIMRERERERENNSSSTMQMHTPGKPSRSSMRSVGKQISFVMKHPKHSLRGIVKIFMIEN